MKNRALFIAVFIFQSTIILGQAGFEQYYYWQDKKPITFVPIIHLQNKKNWYGEARYNYEETRSFSLYAGKNFSREGKSFSYSITPMIGGVVGRFNGASSGVDLTMGYRDFFFSTQSQFTFSRSETYADYIFSWVEFCYEPTRWIYLGASVQHTYYVEQDHTELAPGVVFCMTAGKWSFPLYGFELLNANPYFVLGINLALNIKQQVNN